MENGNDSAVVMHDGPSEEAGAALPEPQERADLGDAFQSTYIDNLEVQLDGLDDQADKTIATLTFTGIEKTSRFDQGEAFSVSWRMERAQGDNQPWLIAGMRQN